MSHSFADVQAEVALLAGGLVAAGIGPGAVVGLWTTNSLVSIVTLLAIARSGATCQLINTRLSAAEAAAQLQEAGAVGVLGGGPDLGVPRIDTTAGPPLDAMVHESNDPCLLVFTSGSSGRPTGVVLTWENLRASVRASAEHLGHTAADRWLAVLPLFHVGGAAIVFRSLWCRSEMVLHERFDAPSVAADLGRCTIASLVPTTLAAVLDAHAGPYAGMKALLVGGGPAPQHLLDRAAAAGLPVLSTYGMTETASQIATARLSDVAMRRVVPIPGAQLRLSPDGEVLVRGPMVATRFLGRPVRSVDQWFATGDLGQIDAQGRLQVTGRLSDVIISGGENVMAGEVERALRSVPGVDDAIVVGVTDARWGEVVAAAVSGEADLASVEAALRDRLAGYKVPRRWMAVSEIPLTSIGKPAKQAVRAMFEEAS